jgi:hypothetical protein
MRRDVTLLVINCRATAPNAWQKYPWLEREESNLRMSESKGPIVL